MSKSTYIHVRIHPERLAQLYDRAIHEDPARQDEITKSYLVRWAIGNAIHTGSSASSASSSLSPAARRFAGLENESLSKRSSLFSESPSLRGSSFHQGLISHLEKILPEEVRYQGHRKVDILPAFREIILSEDPDSLEALAREKLSSSSTSSEDIQLWKMILTFIQENKEN